MCIMIFAFFVHLEHINLYKIRKGETMHLGSGVRTTKAKDLPEPFKRPSTEGMTRVTNRGTGSRASKNKGTKTNNPVF